MVNLALTDVILEALAHFNPSRAMAHSGASSALSIAWSKGRPGQMNQQYEIAGSAYGGGIGHDGVTGPATHLSNLHVSPIEVLEFGVSLPHHPLRPGAGHRRSRPLAWRARHPARV